MTAPSEQLRRRVLEAMAKEPSPARPAARRLRLLTFLVGFVPPLVLLQVFGGILVGGRPTPFFVGTTLGWSVFAALATWGAVGRGRSMLGRPRALLTALTVLTPIALFAWMLVWCVRYPDTMTPDPSHPGVGCLFMTLLLGAAPLVAFVALARDSDPVHPVVTGAAIGAASGAWGATGIALHCPFTFPEHVALGHVLPVVLLAAVGALAGARFVRVRPRAD
jgi:hypothetical protein